MKKAKIPIIFRACLKCKNGYLYSINEYGEPVVKLCSCRKDYMKNFILYEKLKKSNVNTFIYNYDINTYIGKDKNNNIVKLKKYIEEFDTKFYDKMLYFTGKPGTQKTTIAYWIARELLKKDITVQYVLMNDLIRGLQDDSFNEEDKIKKYYECDCLILDRAFCKEQITIYKSKYQIPFLDSFLRKRIDELQKSTILISNIDINEISENNLNDDIEDLIRRKILPYKSLFSFEDHYSLKDNFENINLWG